MRTMLLRTFAVLLMLIIAGGCTPTHFSMHDLNGRMEAVKTIGIVTPDINIYQLSGEGAAKLDHASEVASRNSVEAMMAFFKGTQYKIKVIGPDFKTRRELKEVQALSKAVHKNLPEFWNPVDNPTPPSLGNLESLTDFYRVDALMFMDGFEVHKTEKVSFSKSLAKLAVGTVYGPSALPRQGRSSACVSLAEPTGGVVWASFRDTEISLDENFKDKDGTRKIIFGLLAKFPR